MTIAEAELLDRSMGRLGDTLYRNRRLGEDQRQHDDRISLGQDELAGRMEDRTDLRENRKLALQSQAAHQQRLEAIQQEGNETKRNQMYLDFLGELNKTGQLTDDGLTKMEEAFNKQFGAAGIGVKLFRQGKKGFNTREGQNLGMAEEYRDKAADAAARGDAVDAKRLLSIAERLERGGSPEDEDTASITEKVIDPGADPFAEPRASVTRKVPMSRLDEEMRKLRPPGTNAAPAAASGQPAGGAFETEQAARAAGHKAGDIVQLMINGKATRVRLK